MACFRLSHILLLWREVAVTHIPKTGKSSHLLPKDYRPISLPSFLLKIPEIDVEVIARRRRRSYRHHRTQTMAQAILWTFCGFRSHWLHNFEVWTSNSPPFNKA